MRKPQGQATIIGPTYLETGQPAAPKPLQSDSPWGQTECDTFTCGHCQFVVHVMPLADPADSGGLCKCCMRLICPKCVDKGTCTPWEKAIEKAEAKERFYRAAGLYEH